MTKYIQHTFYNMAFYQNASSKNSTTKIARLKSPPRNEAEDIYIYTRGEYIVKCKDNGYEDIRTPGVFSVDLESEPRGVYEKNNIDESEWWCVSRDELSRENFIVDKVIIEKNHHFNLENNTKYVFFIGSLKFQNSEDVLQFPGELETLNETEIVCVEKIIGYKLTKLYE